MKMRFFIVSGIASVMAVAPFASGAQAKTTLLFNQYLPPSHFVQADILEPWASDVEKATQGRVQVKFTASSLGPPQRQYDLVKGGVAQIAWGTQSYTPGRFLTSECVELPFLSRSAEALSVAYWRAYEAYLKQSREYDGVKLLALHVQTPGQLFSTKGPLKTLGDIEGLKIRQVNPATARLTEALGGVAVSASIAKVYELLSRGVVDGTFLTADSVPKFNLTPYIRHEMTVSGGFYNTSFFVVMNQKVWDDLSPQDKAAIDSVSGEALARRAGRVWDHETEAAQQLLDKEGIQRTQLEGEQLEKLKSMLSGAERDWVGAMQKAGLDGTSVLQMIRQEVEDYDTN